MVSSASSPLIVIGSSPSEAHGEAARPCRDYDLVAGELAGSVAPWVPSASAAGPSGWVKALRAFACNLRAAEGILRGLGPDSVIYTTGETWGLPLGLAAAFTRVPFTHVMYVHRVYSRRWKRALRLLRHLLRVDGWICVTSRQAELLRGVLGPGAEVTAISQGVDTLFFDPALAVPWGEQPYALCVGAEMRNYALLFEAVRGLEIPVVIKASSAWMTSTRQRLGEPPANVQVLSRQLSYEELRSLYAGARLVVVPLYDTPQAAGITTILEGMAMGKCVLATQSAGLPDVLRDGETGRVVTGEAAALGAALRELWMDTAQRERLAGAGYAAVRAECSLEQHAQRVATFVRQVAELRLSAQAPS